MAVQHSSHSMPREDLPLNERADVAGDFPNGDGAISPSQTLFGRFAARLRQTFAPDGHREATESEILRSLFRAQGFGANDGRAPLVLSCRGHIYHDALLRINSLRCTPLTLAHIIECRMNALGALEQQPVYHGKPAAALWDVPFLGSEMVLHFKNQVKFLSRDNFRKLFLEERDAELVFNGNLLTMRSDYAVSRTIYESVPGEEMSFDNSHYVYSLSSGDALATWLWDRVAGELATPYRELLTKHYGKCDMEVWLSVNWACSESQEYALMRALRLGPMTKGSPLEATGAACGYPLTEEAYFVAI